MKGSVLFIMAIAAETEKLITLLLREQDTALIQKALLQFLPETDEEERNHEYLLSIFEMLVLD